MPPRLPMGHEVAPGCRIGRPIEAGHGWQSLLSEDGGHAILAMEAGSEMAAAARRRDRAISLFEARLGGEEWLCALFPAGKLPRSVGALAQRRVRPSEEEVEALALALRSLGEELSGASWEGAVWLPSLRICLTDGSPAGDEDRHGLLIRLLGGGIEAPERDPELVGLLTGWKPGFVARIFAYAGAPSEAPARPAPRPSPVTPAAQRRNDPGEAAAEPLGKFSLPGRPALEKAFIERVLAYFENRAAYERMGVAPPSGILLYGPPGSGKTYAARALAKHLGWKAFEIDLGTVGSPYVHETSQRLRKVFDAAAKDAPALIVIEEADTLLGDRAPSRQDWRIEEANQMLALLERAAERGVLVVATTNRRDAIDPALLRKGRLDIQIEVGMPSAEEADAALSADLARRPTGPGLDLKSVAKRLAGRPMSDVAWVANEAARLAVIQGKERIDQICLLGALKNLG